MPSERATRKAKKFLRRLNKNVQELLRRFTGNHEQEPEQEPEPLPDRAVPPESLDASQPDPPDPSDERREDESDEPEPDEYRIPVRRVRRSATTWRRKRARASMR